MSHMFLCSSCIKGLKFSDDQVEEVVHFSDEKQQEHYKCYICSQQKGKDEGVYLKASKIAEILEKVLDQMDAMSKKVKEGIITCPVCGKEHVNPGPVFDCGCNTRVNTKDEFQRYKLSFVKRTAFRVLIHSIKKGGML